jgi:hypothetical protein
VYISLAVASRRLKPKQLSCYRFDVLIRMSDNSETPTYTVTLNGAEYEVNEEARRDIQELAQNSFEENEQFSCWWKVASPDQYADGEWEETVHDAGDPVLVIETTGPIVPWDRLDQLEVEMQEVGPEGQLDRQMDDADTNPNEKDNGNGLKTIDPDDIDEAEKEIGRTHFSHTPQSYEEVPSPDGEEPDKIPPKPVELGSEPVFIKWIPNHPDLDHTWATGEAITSMYNRVEWNVQKRADQPMLSRDKDTSHDHWESMLSMHDCDVVAELSPAQDVPSDDTSNEFPDEDEMDQEFVDGRANGNNWRV